MSWESFPVHRFYLPAAQCRADLLAFNERETHHAAQVLRLQRGDEVTVLDGEGAELRCEIVATDRRTMQARVLGRRSLPALPCEVTLVQAIPKGKTMDLIVEKAVELGARRIVPLLTERTVVQLDAGEAQAKQEKWQHVASEALKQCGAPWLPRVELPVSLDAFLKAAPVAELALVGSLAERRPARECFADFRAVHGRSPASVAVWVGPEGDFTKAELERIQAGGAKPVSFGPLVLRCDTAAIFGLSIVAYEVMDRRG